MKNSRNFYIDGKWVAPQIQRTMSVVNPATEQVFDEISLGTKADIDAAVAAASRALASYELTTPSERIAIFDRIITSYDARRLDLARTMTTEIGTPLWFSRDYQVGMALAHFTQARELLKTYLFEYKLGDSVIRREPFGVCGLITAWNWPIMLITSKVAPALAAGCTVILKPSEYSALSAIVLAEIMDDAKVPAGVFNLVNGTGPEVGNALSTHPSISLISFTGSLQAGAAIAKAAADTVKSVHQELGGKSANIILPDADLSVAIPDAVRRGFLNSGQSCIAPTRLLVQKDQLAEVIEIARTTAEAMTLGDPFSAETRLGPLANAAQQKRVRGFIQTGIEEGATLVCGGAEMPAGLERGFFIKPTIFCNVTSQMKIAREEIFGPVLSILSYEDEDDAVRIANDTTYGLAGYISSSNLKKARAVAQRLKAGRIFLNGAATNPVAPFGGYKQSGNGREWGVFGLEAYLEVKAVIG